VACIQNWVMVLESLCKLEVTGNGMVGSYRCDGQWLVGNIGEMKADM